jgi:hypothetical protein
MRPRVLLLLGIVWLAGPARAAEISTNGVGGGPWSDPATWRGKMVPGPGDDVVIRKYDVVSFDRPDDGKASCRKLQIDPRGGLTFKTGSGKLLLAVTEGIESFGAIRLDGTHSASDQFEIRLLGDKAEKRQIKLGRGGALLLYGRAGLAKGRCNVLLSAPQPAGVKEVVPASVEAEGAVMLDWQRATVDGIKLSARKIDNTDAKPNERLRISACRFTGGGRLFCQSCDTPEISRCTFDYEGSAVIPDAAIHIHSCALPHIKGNTVRGKFQTCIGVYAVTDPVLMNNTVEKGEIGISFGYGAPNTMLKRAIVKGCASGLKLEGATGVIEDTVVEGATTALYLENSNIQLNNFQVKTLAKKGQAISGNGAVLSLLNCNLTPADIKAVPRAPEAGKKPPILVTCQQFVVVAVKGAPAGTLVEVRSTGAAAGTSDPNVRNSPAPVVDGHTPLANAVGPLLVRSWIVDPAGKLQPAPEYTIKVLGPAPKEGTARPVLQTRRYRPPAIGYRARPDDPTPTLEVSLK